MFLSNHIQRLLLLLCVLTATVFAARGQVIVDTKLDRAEILIGEPAVLTATVTTDKGQRVNFRNYNPTDTLMRGIEVLANGEIDTLLINGNKRQQLTREYIITSFDSALYALPAFAVEVDGKEHLSRSKIGLKVLTVPVDTVHVDQFAPPFYVLESPFEWSPRQVGTSAFIWLIVMGIIILSVLLTSRKPIRRRIVIKPPVPPHKKAQKAMAALEPSISTATSDADNKAYFVALTDIMRTYITERFKFNATESTTQEILDGLCGEIDAANERLLRELFMQADFIKFAKQTANDVERRHCYEQAAQFMASTRDEQMEHPQPEVRIVAYSDERQHQLRIVFAISLGLLILGGAALCVTQVIDIWNAYIL